MSLNLVSKQHVTPPYTKLAVVYDYLMRHVNYKQWAAYVHNLLKNSGEDVHTLLDASCGTGNLIFELSKKDYQIRGFDYSQDMVSLAQKKARAREFDIPLWSGDIRDFALHQEQDAILCLYDSINYLLDIEDCKRFFSACHQNLRVDGLFIFDICTEWNSIRHFQNYVDKDSTSYFKYVRKSHYQREKRIHSNDFKLKFKDDPVTYLEYHRQKIYDVDEIAEAIPKDKFKITGCYHEFTTRKAHERSERVHFILRKIR